MSGISNNRTKTEPYYFSFVLREPTQHAKRGGRLFTAFVRAAALFILSSYNQRLYLVILQSTSFSFVLESGDFLAKCNNFVSLRKPKVLDCYLQIL